MPMKYDLPSVQESDEAGDGLQGAKTKFGLWNDSEELDIGNDKTFFICFEFHQWEISH